MKQITKYFLFLPVIALVLVLASWSGETVSAESETEYAGSVGDYKKFPYRKDTITNAETNTLNIGIRDNSVWNTVTNLETFFSLYTYDISIKPASLSGTQSMKFVLDKSDTNSGTSTDWMAIDSVTSTTAIVSHLRSTDATALRYRIRVVGAGTQSSTYQIWSIWKKKN